MENPGQFSVEINKRVSERDARLAERDAIIERKEERIVRLEKLVADFKRAMFGSKSEKADPDQYLLALEDIETAIAMVHAENEAIDPLKTQPRKRNANRGALPKNFAPCRGSHHAREHDMRLWL